MLMINAENHCNTRKICIFGQTNKQPLCNFLSASFLWSIYKIENTSFLWIKTDRLKNFS